MEDELHYITGSPKIGAQAVYLDGRYAVNGFDAIDTTSFDQSMKEFVDQGVPYLVPPMPLRFTLDEEQNIVPSVYAYEASAAGLNLITWTPERTGSCMGNPNFLYMWVSIYIDFSIFYTYTL